MTDQTSIEVQILKTSALAANPHDHVPVEAALLLRLTTRLEELEGTHGTEVISSLRAALEDCRRFAARSPLEDWAREILRFCEGAGVVGAPLKTEESPDA